MSSQYLADSSLSEDVSQYDFSTPIQVRNVDLNVLPDLQATTHYKEVTIAGWQGYIMKLQPLTNCVGIFIKTSNYDLKLPIPPFNVGK